MARCGCASDQCSCSIVGGSNVTVTGTGSRSNPYVIDSAPPPVAPGSGGTGAMFAGAIAPYAGIGTPSGWLVCDGSAVSRSTYATLYSAIGDIWGAGDGATTFNLPDFRGRFLMGADDTHTQGGTGGALSRSITIQAANLPAHSHSIDHDHPSVTSSTDGSHVHDLDMDLDVGAAYASVKMGTNQTPDAVQSNAVHSAGSHSHTVNLPNYTGSSGNGPGTSAPISIDTAPPWAGVVYCIKY